MQAKPLIFLLGVQRSGTTWLANIVDASPDVFFFMEPFAPPSIGGLFPELPEAAFFLETSSPYLDHILRQELPKRLLRNKTLWFPLAMTETGWFRIERWISQMGIRYGTLRHRERLLKFRNLSLNRMDAAYPLYPKKRDPAVWAIKELRLAGKIPVLLQAFPDAHFLVIIRHPCATVQSILQWFEQGRLGELKRDLHTYLDKIAVQNVAAPYHHLIARCRAGSLAQKIALYWRISYETMCRQLADHPGTCLLVYEHLATQPADLLRQVFGNVGIPWSGALDDYIAYSTSTTPEQAHTSAINTVRQSAVYYKAWTKKITETTQRDVLDMTGDSDLMAHFAPYY
jgi:hypothetical protein